jgi:bifunctional non-homologous end joining protein LigD
MHMNNQAVAQVTLHNNSGNSDKVYECVVVRSGDLYLVNTQNGRRGGSMTPRTKTKHPVSLEAAMKIFDTVVKEKKADNYFELRRDNSLSTPAASNDATGAFHQPQLLNDIDRDTAMLLIEDDEWLMEEKKDGKRIAVAINATEVRISNKSARACSIPVQIVDAIRSLKSVEYVGPVFYIEADGELVGDTYHVFDILAIDGSDLRQLPYETRAACYAKLIGRNKALSSGSLLDAIASVETFYGAVDKRAAFARIERMNGEGVVFKRGDMLYAAGRPNSGGPALKFKFKESSTVICLGESVDGKRSIRLGLLSSEGAIVSVGKVTVPPNQPVPKLDDLVEVRYLYWFENGSLFQPVLLGIRDDQNRSDCTFSQVKRIKTRADIDTEDDNL